VRYPILLPTAFLAYSFGLRHAVDAAHIAAIDNTTRELMQDGERPVGVRIVLVFLVSWLGSTARYRWKGYDRLPVRSAAGHDAG